MFQSPCCPPSAQRARGSASTRARGSRVTVADSQAHGMCDVLGAGLRPDGAAPASRKRPLRALTRQGQCQPTCRGARPNGQRRWVGPDLSLLTQLSGWPQHMFSSKRNCWLANLTSGVWLWQEAADAERAAAEAQCPPGLRLVGPEEKERILQTLADEKAKATLELQSLPFVIKTKASQQRKDKLEDR